MTDTRQELAETIEEYLKEWRRTCKNVGLPYSDFDAAQFIAEGLSGRKSPAEVRAAQAEALREAADAAQATGTYEGEDAAAWLRERADALVPTAEPEQKKAAPDCPFTYCAKSGVCSRPLECPFPAPSTEEVKPEPPVDCWPGFDR